jgi:hypothetical protein
MYQAGALTSKLHSVNLMLSVGVLCAELPFTFIANKIAKQAKLTMSHADKDDRKQCDFHRVNVWVFPSVVIA